MGAVAATLGEVVTVCLRLGPESHEPLRRALLQRLANDLAVARELDRNPDLDGLWPCCWVSFEMTQRFQADGVRPEGLRRVACVHRICDDDCAHWHHQTEVFLA